VRESGSETTIQKVHRQNSGVDFPIQDSRILEGVIYMADHNRFLQIVTAGDGAGRAYLFALDAEGDVWQYVFETSQKHGAHWRSLSRERKAFRESVELPQEGTPR